MGKKRTITLELDAKTIEDLINDFIVDDFTLSESVAQIIEAEADKKDSPLRKAILKEAEASLDAVIDGYDLQTKLEEIVDDQVNAWVSSHVANRVNDLLSKININALVTEAVTTALAEE